MKASIRAFILPAVIFTGLTAVMTWPLILNAGQSVAGQFGDNLEYVWMIRWFEESLFRLHISPFFVATVNYPEGWSPAHSELPLTMVLPVLPISLRWGPVAAYNGSILLSYILSGLFVYAWLKRTTGDGLSALVAGSIFAFSPYRYSHFLAGHLNLLGTHWIPLYFMALFAVLLETGRRRGFPLVAGLSLGMIALTSQYYLYMTVLLTVILLLARLVWVSRWQGPDRDLWPRLGCLALTSIPLVGLALAPFLALNAAGDLPSRSVEYVRQYSASPTDFLLPATTSLASGLWVGRNFDRSYWIEATLYLGAFALLLAGLGVIRSLSHSRERAFVILVLALVVSAAILALGTDLHWLSRPVMVEVPDVLRQWHPQSAAHVPLPGRVLFEWLPFYNRMRVSMRYGVFVLLGVSVLAGLGFAWIKGALSGKLRWVLPLVLFGLILLDFLPRPQAIIKVQPRPVDLWLASQTDSGALVEFPFESDQAQLYYTLTHRKPFLGGNFNAFPPPQYQRIKPVLDSFPDRASIGVLRDLGVRYVLVHAWRYADFDQVDRRARELGLVSVDDFDGIRVYTLEADSLAP